MIRKGLLDGSGLMYGDIGTSSFGFGREHVEDGLSHKGGIHGGCLSYDDAVFSLGGLCLRIGREEHKCCQKSKARMENK
jgi:hypothetical protein